jgi:pyranose oxidase
MGSYWTCCTPRQLPGLERSTLFSDNEWDELYHQAETLFRTNRTTFDKSIRHQLVKHVLLDAYKSTKREFSSMPLACDRNRPNREYVEWTCPATILGDLSEPKNDNKLFELRANTQCTKLQLDTATGQVAWAVVSDLLNDRAYAIKAKKYVVCAGAVLTPGILVNSGLDAQLPAPVSLRSHEIRKIDVKPAYSPTDNTIQ